MKTYRWSVSAWIVLFSYIIIGTSFGGESQNQPSWFELRLLKNSYQLGYLKVQGRDGKFYYASVEAIVDCNYIADVELTQDSAVTIFFTVGAAKRLEEFTACHIRERIGAFINGELRSAGVILDTLPGYALTLQQVFASQEAEDFVRSWSAPVDTRPGRHKLNIQGLGDIEVELQGSVGGAGVAEHIQFFHEGSIYQLPLSFLSRPGVPAKTVKLLKVSVWGDKIKAEEQELSGLRDLKHFIETNTGPEQLILIEILESDVDDLPQEWKEDLADIAKYTYDSPYVGLCQIMSYTPYFYTENKIYIPPEMQKAINEYDPDFKLYSDSNFLPSVIKYYTYTKHQAPFAVIGDFTGDSKTDVVLYGYNSQYTKIIGVISSNKDYKVIEIIKHDYIDPKKEWYGMGEGQKEYGLWTYLVKVTPKTIKSPYEKEELILRNDAFEHVYFSKAAVLYYYKNGKFLKYQTSD